MSNEQNLRNYIELCKIKPLKEICSMIDNINKNLVGGYSNNDINTIKNVSNMYNNDKQKLVDIYDGYYLFKIGGGFTDVANITEILKYQEEIKKDITKLFNGILKEITKLLKLDKKKCLNKKDDIKKAVTNMMSKTMDKLPLGPIGFVAKPIIKESMYQIISEIIDQQFKGDNMHPINETPDKIKQNITELINNFFITDTESKKIYMQIINKNNKLQTEIQKYISSSLIHIIKNMNNINNMCK